MTDGKEILNELDFDKDIKSKPDRELAEFTARQVYDICTRCAKEDKRITTLEGRIMKLTIGLVIVAGGGGIAEIIKLVIG